MLTGLVVGLIGAWLFVTSGLDNVLHAATWLVAGVAAHDGVLAPATLLVVVIAARALPDWARVPMTVGLVVLGTVTIMAIPVLGRFGARPDNPSLLDRDYTAGWLWLTAAVLVSVAAAAWWRRLHPAGDRQVSTGDDTT